MTRKATVPRVVVFDIVRAFAIAHAHTDSVRGLRAPSRGFIGCDRLTLLTGLYET